MKKRNLAMILPLIASSLAFTGCNTTQTSSTEAKGSYVMGSKAEIPIETVQARSLIEAKKASTLESKFQEIPLRSTSNYFYDASHKLNYDTSELYTKKFFREDELTVDNDLVTFIDSKNYSYVPDINYWVNKGDDISSRTKKYTNISKRTSSGWNFDTDFDVWDPKDSKIELTKKFSNGSKLVIEGTPDDKKYAEIVYTVPWPVAVKPVQAMIAWIK